MAMFGKYFFEPNASNVNISRVKTESHPSIFSSLKWIPIVEGGIFAPCTLDLIKELNDWSFENPRKLQHNP